MRFESPDQLQHLFWILLLLVLSLFLQKRQSRKLQSVISPKLIPFLTSSVSPSKRKWKLALQFFTLVLMMLAWARPQGGASKQEVKSEGIELVFAVDVSESMLAEDVRPNRLEQAKAEVSRLMDLMPGNKMGLIAFAGSAQVLSPLTSDPGALKLYVDSLSPLSVSSQGTHVADALQAAVESFKRGGAEKDESTQVTRVILILSDGEDHEQGALDQAEKLVKEENIRIFTIAYGTEKGAPIPERDAMGFLRGYKKDESGQTVLSTVKGDFLRKLAEMGKGSFYFSAFAGPHLNQIKEDVDQLEKTLFDSEMATQYEERFQIFLFAAFVLGLIEILLTERRSQLKLWKGRFEVPPA
ncbi:MAG: VWA domain-containing protein [Proteobacteria bacterium]|nr:VWA domain-containing protein [Pseudomonadota bacterium]